VPSTVGAIRGERVERVATNLLAQTSLLSRLLAKEVMGGRLTRTEAGALRTLMDGPRRITELAELEGLAQPTTTLLVKRLEEQGLVVRDRSGEDQRVVLVSLTDAGREALEQFLTRAHATMRKHLDAMPDEQLEALAEATEALEGLIGLLVGDSLERGTAR
jgi:DNA-binding MarR family transcriptional regulator